jgi:hypothetical protein
MDQTSDGPDYENRPFRHADIGPSGPGGAVLHLALRQALQTTYAPIWKELRELADRAVKQGPPVYRERDNYSGDEQLWQREVGNKIIFG